MKDKKKVYVGNGRRRFENLRSISVCLEDLQAYAKKSNNGKHYVNLNVSDKLEVDQYGKDVSVSIDTWSPEKVQENASKAPQNATENDLPF